MPLRILPCPCFSPNDAEEWVGINYLELEARNQQLGDAGEKLVMAYEKARLRTIGRIDLLDSVEQVSETLGPNAGYDIRSFEQDGKERFIEVKTTKYGKLTPFFVTANELLFLREIMSSTTSIESLVIGYRLLCSSCLAS